MIPCAWVKKSAKPFSVEAAMLFSKKSTAKALLYRNNRSLVPQGLKPKSLLDLCGTAEAVPFPKPISETAWSPKTES
jgi:hypothetical protein